jgi:hypothetical protein
VGERFSTHLSLFLFAAVTGWQHFIHVQVALLVGEASSLVLEELDEALELCTIDTTLIFNFLPLSDHQNVLTTPTVNTT